MSVVAYAFQKRDDKKISSSSIETWNRVSKHTWTLEAFFTPVSAPYGQQLYREPRDWKRRDKFANCRNTHP